MTQPTEAESKLIDKSGNFQIGDRESAVADVTGTAAGGYDSVEVDMINDTKTAINNALSKMRKHGLIAD